MAVRPSIVTTSLRPGVIAVVPCAASSKQWCSLCVRPLSLQCAPSVLRLFVIDSSPQSSVLGLIGSDACSTIVSIASCLHSHYSLIPACPSLSVCVPRRCQLSYAFELLRLSAQLRVQCLRRSLCDRPPSPLTTAARPHTHHSFLRINRCHYRYGCSSKHCHHGPAFERH